MLAFLPRLALLRGLELGAELVETAVHGLELLAHQADARQQQANVAAGGLGGARRHGERLLPQRLKNRLGIDAADAVLGEDALDHAAAELLGFGRGRRLMPERQEPRRRQVVAGHLERLRIVAPQLLAHPVAEPIELCRQVIAHA